MFAKFEQQPDMALLHFVLRTGFHDGGNGLMAQEAAFRAAFFTRRQS
jgi:hypothetical protein